MMVVVVQCQVADKCTVEWEEWTAQGVSVANRQTTCIEIQMTTRERGERGSAKQERVGML